MQVQTELTKLLGIQSPVVLPPMAGAAGGELVGKVSLGGGYGFIGAALLDIASFAKEIDKAASVISSGNSNGKKGSLPFGVGYLAWILDKQNSPDIVKVALERRVDSIWLSFGPNLDKWVNYIRQYDKNRQEDFPHLTKIWILVNSLEEAKRVVSELNPDVLVVQGIEAGGHGHSQALPLISLFPLIKSSIHQLPPVIVAGGIANGSQIAGFLVMGADGAVIGTRYLATPESQYSKNQKNALLEAQTSERTFVFDEVRGTTGWPTGVDGRGLRNITVEEAEKGGIDKDERMRRYDEATKKDDVSRRVVWAGSSVGLVNEIIGAEALTLQIGEEIVNNLKRAETLLV